MEKVFPKVEYLYIAIINDCYIFFLEHNQKDPSVKELIKKAEEQIDVKDAITILKSSMVNNQPQNNKFIHIAYFTSKYIDSIYEFFSQEKIDNIEVKYYHEYCLAYIALVGYESFFLNIEDDQLFSFQADKHRFFSNFLDKFSVLTDIKKYYENYSTQIKKKYKLDANSYLYLIVKFDADNRFYSIPEEQEKYGEDAKNESKQIEQKQKKGH